MMLFKFDESQILHILSAIEFRIDYYNDRVKAIENLKGGLEYKNYVHVMHDAFKSRDYFKLLKQEILRQQDNQNKLQKLNDVMAEAIKKSGLGIKS